MKKRVLTGAFIFIITVLVILSKFLPHTIGDYIFDIFVLSIAIVAGFEMSNLMEKINRPVSKFLSSLFAVFNYIIFMLCVRTVAFSVVVGIELLSLILYFVIIVLVEFFKDKKKTFNNYLTMAFNTVIASLYPTFWLLLLVNINHADFYAGTKYFSLVFIILTFAITMFTDTFAMLVGSLIKGPKLAPKISPNKTISGSIGGVVGGVVAALLVYAVVVNAPSLSTMLSMYNLSWWQFMLFGLVGSLFCQIGDLFESKLKRNAGVKDASNIFPGHGGMLDRVDGLIFVGIFFFFVVAIMLL